MLLLASLFRPSTLRSGALITCSLLAACPQLLDDEFEELRLPPVGLTSNAGMSGGSSPALGSDGAAGASNDGTSGGAGPGNGGGGAASLAPDAGLAPSAGSGGTDGPGDADSGASSGPGAALRAALLHRYRFDEAGTIIADSIGAAHGSAINAQVSAGSGKIVLGGDDEYVDLPNGLLAGLTSVTLEAWVNWAAEPGSAAANWQTVFVLGSNDAGEGSPGDEGTSYVYVTAKSGDSGELRAGYTLAGYDGELFADAARPLPTSANAASGTQVVLVIRGTAEGGRLSVYIDGALEAASPSGQSVDLSAIADVNNWLGQSQFSSDPNFNGDFLEFRVYGAALSDADIALSHSLGADAEL